MTIDVGSVIHDRYKVVRKLGEGGMGAVYEVEHVQLGRKLALKTLHPELVRSADVVARFQREARAAASVGSPHIVDVVDLGTAEGTPFIVMEYLDGGSLRELLEEQGQVPLARALAIMTQCCKALAKAHAKGIVHRDLKPDNIMLVDRDGVDFVKLVDFGIAKLIADSLAVDAVATTRTGITMGTPQYMSPEQIAGASDIDGRADVWAMGAVLFELLTGKPPFEAATMPMLAIAIHTGKTPSVRDLRPAIPARLDAIVQKALAKARDERFATIADFGAAIDALKMSPAATTQKPAGAFAYDDETRVDTSRPAGASTTGARVSTTPQAWDVDDSRPPRRTKRVGLFVGIGAFGLLAVGGGFALALVFAGPDEPRRPATTLAEALGDRSVGDAAPPVATVGSERATTGVADPTDVIPAATLPPPHPAATLPPPQPIPDQRHDADAAVAERRAERTRASTSRRESTVASPSPTSAVESPRPPSAPTPPRAPASASDPPRPATTRRIAIRNTRQLAVTVSLTCGDGAPMTVRVPAGATRTVTADGPCRSRCDDGVSVGSLCGTRLAANATSLVIR